jgi:hypothetical protein
MTISRMQQPRQLYGLGSLVKKITKPIKKIVKSPIGKAALGAAAIYGLGGGFGAGGFRAGNIPGIGRFFSRGRDLSTIASGKAPTGILSRLFSGAKKGFSGLSGGQQAFLGGGALLSALPFFMGGEEEEEITADDGFDVTPSTIANIRQMAKDRDPSLAFLPQEQFVRPGFFSPFTAAEGGRAQLAGGGNRVTQLLQLLEGTKDPMDRRMIQQEIDMLLGKFAKGGIADLPEVRMLEGGMPEIDYRQSGGFVPVGKKEKADDVPAMLSKNEFVMTADAVRGMGDGNVEKGAQKMYDQMKQLENRTV